MASAAVRNDSGVTRGDAPVSGPAVAVETTSTAGGGAGGNSTGVKVRVLMATVPTVAVNAERSAAFMFGFPREDNSLEAPSYALRGRYTPDYR